MPPIATSGFHILSYTKLIFICLTKHGIFNEIEVLFLHNEIFHLCHPFLLFVWGIFPEKPDGT